jgi:hypothetical protein
MPDEARQFLGDALRRQDQVHAARRDSAERHAVEFGGLPVLSERNPARFFDGFEAGRSVGGRARQNDADRLTRAALGERGEEVVDGLMTPGGGPTADNVKQTVQQTQVGIGGNDVDVVRLHVHSLADLLNRHFGGPGEQRGQSTFVRGLQVLDQHEGQAGIGRQGAEQSSEGFQSSGGGADPDYGRDCLL